MDKYTSALTNYKEDIELLVKSLIRKYGKQGIKLSQEYDDLIQVSYIKLYNLLSNKHINNKPYIMTAIRHDLIKYIDKISSDPLLAAVNRGLY